MERRDFLKLTGLAALSGCLGLGGGDGSGEAGPPLDVGDVTEIDVSSSAFNEGGNIPEKYTCDGEDVSPPLSFEGVPSGAKALAVIVDDPDAREVAGKIWTHWVIWNIPPDTTRINEGVPQKKIVESLGGARQGKNDFSSNNIGYRGPCPPSGTHTYRFFVYALDTQLGLEAGSTKSELVSAMEGNVVGEGKLSGEYGSN